jgi:hypothetical protein
VSKFDQIKDVIMGADQPLEERLLRLETIETMEWADEQRALWGADIKCRFGVLFLYAEATMAMFAWMFSHSGWPIVLRAFSLPTLFIATLLLWSGRSAIRLVPKQRPRRRTRNRLKRLKE